MENDKFECRRLTPLEEDILYGKRKVKIGKCFNDEYNHYYKQQKDFVLHLFDDENNFLISRTLVGFLNKYKNLKEISEDEFDIKMKKVIYELELYKYW